MDRRSVRIAALVCVLSGLLSAGCGYRAGFTMPEGIETIYVKVFANETFYRELDFDLTQAVKREILNRTKLDIVREQNADVVLSCTVRDVVENVLRADENDAPQEVALSLAISAQAVDRRGRTVYETASLSKSVRYVVILGEDERLARAKALGEVAEELVYRMVERMSWLEETESKAEAEEADTGTVTEEED